MDDKENKYNESDKDVFDDIDGKDDDIGGKDKKSSDDDGKSEDDKEYDAMVKKVLFSLCYLWGILFFIPLIMYKDDDEAKTHANEGLVLLLISIVGNALCGIFTGIFMGNAIGTTFSILLGVFNVLVLLLGILGIVNVVTENGRSLPVIGTIKLIK